MQTASGIHKEGHKQQPLRVGTTHATVGKGDFTLEASGDGRQEQKVFFADQASRPAPLGAETGLGSYHSQWYRMVSMGGLRP